MQRAGKVDEIFKQMYQQGTYFNCAKVQYMSCLLGLNTGVVKSGKGAAVGFTGSTVSGFFLVCFTIFLAGCSGITTASTFEDPSSS